MAFNYTFPVDYQNYADFSLGIYDKILDLLRGDDEVKNYQFKAVELVGNDFIPDDSGLPVCRLVPDPDNILQNSTNTRDHHLRMSIVILDLKRDKGEDSYREHVQIAGRIYDLLINNRSLDGLVEDMETEQVATQFGFSNEAGGGMNFVSTIRTRVFVVKSEGQP